MADRIDQLPRTNENPSLIDSNIMKDLMKDSSDKNINWKTVLILTAVFAGLNLPVIDTAFKSSVYDSDLVLLASKIAAFIIVLAILKST